MLLNWLRVASCAICCGSLGTLFYVTQPDLAEPLLNPLIIVSFTSLGAGVGCLLSSDDSRGWPC